MIVSILRPQGVHLAMAWVAAAFTAIYGIDGLAAVGSQCSALVAAGFKPGHCGSNVHLCLILFLVDDSVG